MDESFDIIGMGAALLDLSANTDDAFLRAHNIAKGNMTLLESKELKSFYQGLPIERTASGGATANSLVAASHFGARAGFIGLVGTDDLGARYIADLEKERVRWLGGQTDKTDSGVCLSLTTQDGQRSMLTALGASTFLTEETLSATRLERTKILLLESYLWDSPTARQTAIKAAELVSPSCLVALNLSDSLCVERHFDSLQNFTSERVNILIANEVEAKSFYQTPNLQLIEEAVKAQNFSFAAITMSEKGALVFEGGESTAIEAVPIKKLVDSTGAGDAFAGGFLYAISAGLGVAEGGQLGALWAARVIQHFGARE